MSIRARALLPAIALATFVTFAAVAAPLRARAADDPSFVVIVSRHGVRSPTDPAELNPYAARAWPAWSVAPGNLTPHGAAAMRLFGAAYRALYSPAMLPAAGCPPPDAIYVWADVDERTKATAAALLDGLAPNCGIVPHDLGAAVDPLFHALPALGTADAAVSSASLTGLVHDPTAVVRANAAAFARLDTILGCANEACRRVSSVPSSVRVAAKSGLASVAGAVDLASTAVEDFILAYADGKPLSDVGWGAVDRETLLGLSQLHVLKFALNTQTPYAARTQGSNLLAHVRATLDQGATGVANAATRAPRAARFVAFVGHDTNLAELAGLLRVRWLLGGYQVDDTPPGGALVFEIHRALGTAAPVVRVFYTAQSLDDMRTLSKTPPQRTPVFVPGCPSLDCPLPTFDRIVETAIDPAFVGAW